jgi:alginate O-acetyltransferase complex protein AlgJ
MSKIRKFIPKPESDIDHLLIGWNLETPTAEPLPTDLSELLTISGWVMGHSRIEEVIIQAPLGVFRGGVNLHRPDVISFFLGKQPADSIQFHSGFSIETYATLENFSSFDFGIVIGGHLTWLGTFVIGDNVKVLEGRNGWLFLDNDTNNSVDQFIGIVGIDPDQQIQWKSYISDFDKYALHADIKWLMSVTPAKEYVFQDYYPHALSTNNPPALFLSMFTENLHMHYPLQLLTENRELSYWKGDTHWTDYGAYLVSKDIINRLGLGNFHSPADVEPRFYVQQMIGDLSEKLSAPLPHPNVRLKELGTHVETVYDNCIKNNGRVIIYCNQKANSKHTLVVFGSSSSYALITFLSVYFSRTVFIHSAASIDTKVIEHEKPSHVLLQSNARFINVAPEPLGNYSLENTINTKLTGMSELEYEITMRDHSSNSPGCEPFYSSLITHSPVKK